MNIFPKVSVCMITYNHENFIREAIEGVLMQKTNFPIELVIGEDCSTDNTRKIVMEYAESYPERIRVLLPDKNLGVRENFINTLKLCKGEYIALCEGDDYWIDSTKIQSQVDYMEVNRNCSLVHTNGYWSIAGNLTPWNEYETLSGDVAITFYYGNIVRTCSAMLKANLIKEFIEISKKLESNIICDWPLFAFYSTKGEFGYINNKMSVYRLNPNSVTSRKNSISQLNYELDVVKMKRFLRDVLFPNVLDNLYSERILVADENHAKLKKYFRSYEYKNAKSIFAEKLNLNQKSMKLKKYTLNAIVFYLSCFYKNNLQNI